MTLEQIDSELAQWQARLSLASANLLDLDDLFTFKRLRGDIDLPPAQLSGLTESKVIPALSAIKMLWEYLQLLRSNLEKASALRRSLSRIWMPEHTIRQIQHLLSGPSITLPSTQTALADRSLLSGAQVANSSTMDQMLAKMTRIFELSKATIMEVDSAWARLDKVMMNLQSEANALKQIAEMLKETDADELQAALQRIAYLHSRIETDPLGVTNDLQNQISPQLDRVREYLNGRKLERNAVQGHFLKAGKLISDLNSMNLDCTQALASCRKEIANPTGLFSPLPDTVLIDLEQWRGTLEDTLREGKWRPARIGIERWIQTAEGYKQTLTTALNANRNAIELKAELKGRLGSLRAKARSYQQRGVAFDSSLEQIAREADRILNVTPTPVYEALKLVEEYERKLLGRGA